MKSKNKITFDTRKEIADFFLLSRIEYNGNINEADFLNRLYPLSEMKSTDYRVEYNNAYKDIKQHVVNNIDWNPGWVFNDERFNLNHCEDNIYLKFLILYRTQLKEKINV